MIGSRARGLGILCLAAAMALAIAACGGSSSKSSKTSAATNSTCKPKHTFKTVDGGTLTVVAVEYMPFGGVDGSTPTGVDGDMLSAIAKLECLDIKATAVDAAGAIPQVTTGRADVAAGDWWRSKERVKVVDITDPTYLDTMAVLSKDGLSSMKELEGKNVGDLQGNIWNGQAKAVVGSGYHLYQTIDQVLRDLDNGRLDAAIVTTGLVGYEQSKGKYTQYKLELMQSDPRVTGTTKQPQSGIPYSKKNPQLGVALSEDIAALKADGTLERIVTKYGLPKSVLDTGSPYLI